MVLIISLIFAVGLTVAAIVLWYSQWYANHYKTGIVRDTCLVCAILFWFIVFCSGFVMSLEYNSASADKARLEQEYNNLVFKAQASEVRDEFGFFNKEYIDEIGNWNSSLAYHKEHSHNFWTGILYPDIYDDLEFIDLSEFAVQ